MGAKATPTLPTTAATPGFVGAAMQRAIAIGTGQAVPRGVNAPIATPAQASQTAAAATAAADRVRKGGTVGKGEQKRMPSFMGGY